MSEFHNVDSVPIGSLMWLFISIMKLILVGKIKNREEFLHEFRWIS